MSITLAAESATGQRNTEQFFYATFAGVTTGGYLRLAFLDRATGRMRQRFLSYPDELADVVGIVGAASGREECYFSPFLYKVPGDGKKSNVADVVSCLWADADTCAPETFALTPSVVWQSSPGRWVALWYLSEAVEKHVAEDASKRIAHFHKDDGCDTSGWDLSQLLRITETPNLKYSNVIVGSPVTMAGCYTIADFDVFPTLPEETTTEVAVVDGEPLDFATVSAKVRDLVEKPIEPNDGEKRLHAITCLMYEEDHTQGEIVTFIEDWAAKHRNRFIGRGAEQVAKCLSIKKTQDEKKEQSQQFFAKGSGLLLTKLIAAVENTGPLAVDHGKNIFRYADGVWTPDGESEIRRRTARLLGDRYRPNHSLNVLDVIKHREPVFDDESYDTSILNLPNGLLNWRTGELQPHDPKIANTIRMPVEWHPYATCPAIDKWLSEVFPADAIEFALEIIGYCMLYDEPLHKSILLYARGRNGKGTYLRLIRALIGGKNICAVSPQSLDDNRFLAAELYGKLANLVGDVDPRKFQATQMFKQATGGDVFTSERKFGHPFDFRNRSTMIAAFNALPTTADTTDGFFSRWIVLPFPNHFPENRADPSMLEKLTSESELQGLLVRAVNGLRNLMQREHFLPPGSVATATNDFRRVADPVRAFMEDRLTASPETWTPRANLYYVFEEWADDAELAKPTPAKFYEGLESASAGVFGVQISKRKRDGQRGYLGVAINQPLEGGNG